MHRFSWRIRVILYLPTFSCRLENPTNSSKIQTRDQQAEYVEIQDSFEKLLRDRYLLFSRCIEKCCNVTSGLLCVIQQLDMECRQKKKHHLLEKQTLDSFFSRSIIGSITALFSFKLGNLFISPPAGLIPGGVFEIK